MKSENADIFARTAPRVVVRLTVAHWARWLARTAGPVFASLAVLWLALRLAGVRDQIWWALGLAALWLAAPGVWAWRRRPEPFEALAAWDVSAGQRETFASAWFFETTTDTRDGARLHLEHARDQLARREPLLRSDLPIRGWSRGWLVAVLFLAFVFSGWLRPPIAGEEQALSDSARRTAGEISGELQTRTAALEPVQSLTEEEKERLQKLKDELKAALKKMDRANTPRDLLEQLERNAFDAEKLSNALRTEDLDTLSSAFLTELEENADTADFGNALRSGELGAIAERARDLRDKLEKQRPTLEEQKRLEEALKRALAAASEQDRQSRVGAALSAAQRQLAAGNPSGAGQQFGQLSQHFQRQAQRQLTQKQLRALAQSFRGAGQKILGGTRNLQRLPPSAPSGTAPLLAPMPGGTSMQAGRMANLTGSPLPGARTGMLPVPGPSSSGRPGSMSFPIPGAGQNPGPASMPAAATPMAGAGGFPVPGAGGGVGGSQAGNGSAPLGNTPTRPIDSQRTGVVAAAATNEGESEKRAVQGESHREQSARRQQQLAITFIKAEEAALADEPIPASRREQVLRYFTALRQQFEPQP